MERPREKGDHCSPEEPEERGAEGKEEQKDQKMEGRCFLAFLMGLGLSTELGTASKEGTQADGVCCAASRSAKPPKSCGTCGAGQCCKDEACRQCTSLFQCPEGKELYCTGTIEYRYSCKECPNGTYSEAYGSCCSPWTDCRKIGLWIVEPGNKTRNVVCGLKSTAVHGEPENPSHWIPAEGFLTFVIILTAASVLMLTIMAFCLIAFLINHRAKLCAAEEPKSVHPLDLPGTQLDQEDTFSCQFPEEECGGRELLIGITGPLKAQASRHMSVHAQ